MKYKLAVVFIFIFMGVTSAVYAQNFIPDSQSPDEALNSILEPIANFIKDVVRFVGKFIAGLLDFSIWRDVFHTIFDPIESLFYKIFGVTLVEVFGWIGDVLISFFHIIWSFFRRIWIF